MDCVDLHFSSSCQLLEYYYVNNDARTHTNTLLIMDCVGLRFFFKLSLTELHDSAFSCRDMFRHSRVCVSLCGQCSREQATLAELSVRNLSAINRRGVVSTVKLALVTTELVIKVDSVSRFTAQLRNTLKKCHGEIPTIEKRSQYQLPVFGDF